MASWMKEEQKREEVAVESKVTTKLHKSAVTIWCTLLKTDTGRFIFYPMTAFIVCTTRFWNNLHQVRSNVNSGMEITFINAVIG
jgi:hypothetical protein